MSSRDYTICPLTGLPRWLADKISVFPMTGCWLWTGAVSRGDRCGGYGSVRWKGASRQAHRVVWEHLHGPLSDDTPLDHVKSRGCASILCVNDAHLEPVTRSVNNQRSTCHHHEAFVRNIKRQRRSIVGEGLARAWANAKIGVASSLLLSCCAKQPSPPKTCTQMAYEQAARAYNTFDQSTFQQVYDACMKERTPADAVVPDSKKETSK